MPTIIPIPYNTNSTNKLSDKELLAFYIVLTGICLILTMWSLFVYVYKRYKLKDHYAYLEFGFFHLFFYGAWCIITGIGIICFLTKIISKLI